MHMLVSQYTYPHSFTDSTRRGSTSSPGQSQGSPIKVTVGEDVGQAVSVKVTVI